MLTLAGDESLKFVAGEYVVEVEQIETVSFNEVDLLPAIGEVAVMFFKIATVPSSQRIPMLTRLRGEPLRMLTSLSKIGSMELPAASRAGRATSPHSEMMVLALLADVMSLLVGRRWENRTLSPKK